MSLDPFLENFSIDLDDDEPDTLDCEEKGIDALPEGVLSAPRSAHSSASLQRKYQSLDARFGLAFSACSLP